LYGALVGCGWVSPVDFWRLHPFEIWWLIDAKKPPPEKTFGMSQQLIDELSELLDKGHF
jgi:hypothetical protein